MTKRWWKRGLVAWLLAGVVFNGAMAVRTHAEWRDMQDYCQGEPFRDCIEPYGWFAFDIGYLAPWAAGDSVLILVGAAGLWVLWPRRRERASN